MHPALVCSGICKLIAPTHLTSGYFSCFTHAFSKTKYWSSVSPLWLIVQEVAGEVGRGSSVFPVGGRDSFFISKVARNHVVGSHSRCWCNATGNPQGSAWWGLRQSVLLTDSSEVMNKSSVSQALGLGSRKNCHQSGPDSRRLMQFPTLLTGSYQDPNDLLMALWWWQNLRDKALTAWGRGPGDWGPRSLRESVSLTETKRGSSHGVWT